MWMSNSYTIWWYLKYCKSNTYFNPLCVKYQTVFCVYCFIYRILQCSCNQNYPLMEWVVSLYRTPSMWCHLCIFYVAVNALMEMLTFRLVLQGVTSSFYYFLSFLLNSKNKFQMVCNYNHTAKQSLIWNSTLSRTYFEWPKCWHMCVKRWLFKVLMFYESDLNFNGWLNVKCWLESKSGLIGVSY